MRINGKVIFWSVVLTLWLVAGYTVFGGVSAQQSASVESNAPTAQEKQDYTYNGKNEPDNPECPDPNSDYSYKEHGHNCAPSGEKWSSHWWMYGPGAHQPGAEDASYAWRSWPVKEDFDMEYYEYVAIGAPWGQFGDCAVSDAQAAGIDRMNDNSPKDFHTTKSDEGMVQDIQNSEINDKYGYWQFAGPDDPANRGIHLNSTDSFVAAVGNCFVNPQEEGWYRMTIWFNGTGYDGNKVAWKGMGQWTYICADCENRQDAYNKFGPPGTNPDSKWKDTTVSKGGDGGDGDNQTPTPTATPTEGDGQGTPTATPTEGDGQGTPTATPTEGDGQGTPTASPTDGGQPGFGVGLTITALIAIALLARIRH